MPSVPGQRKAGKNDNLPAKSKSDKVHVPANIAEHPERKEVWDFMVEDMKFRGIWSPTYTFIVSEIAETYQRLTSCRAALDEEGDLVPKLDREGNLLGMMKNPRAELMLSYQAKMLTLIEKVGMSPKDIMFLGRSETVTPGDATEAVVAEKKKQIIYFRD
jgi:hypothetical protein